MKNTIGLLVIISLSILSGKAQMMEKFKNGKLVFGDEIKTKNNITNYIGKIDNSLYLTSKPSSAYKQGKVILHKVSENALSQEIEKEIKLEYKGKKMTLAGFTIFNNKLIAFGSYINKSVNKTFVFAQEINPTNLEPKGNPTLINEKDRSKGVFGGSISHNYETTLAETFLIAYSESYAVKNSANGNIAIAVLGKDLNQVISRTVEFQIPNKFMEVQDVDVDINGTAYILVKENLRKGGDVKNKEVNVRFRLFELKSNEELKEIKVETKDNLVAAANILIYNNKLYVSGIYMDYNRKAEGLKGVFLAEISKSSGEVKQVITKEVGSDFFKEGLSEKDQKKVDKKLKKGKSLGENYKLRDIVQLSDGSYIMTAEERYRTEHTATSQNGGTTTYYIYHRNNILLTKLSPTGEIEWVQNIRKKQAVKNTSTGTSYTICHDAKNLYLVFNSNNKNLNLAKTYDAGKVASFSGSAKKSFAEIVSVELDNGEYKRNMLFSSKESETAVIPSASSMVDNHCFIYSVRGKRKQFTTLTF
jgi:hypothetical protein